MKAKTAKELLIAAKWILEHVGWCQHVSCRWPGPDVMGKGRGSPEAYCLTGAMNVVECEPSCPWPDATMLVSILIGSDQVAVWNDDPKRTKKQVLALLDKAIARA